jgi:hypothetical protein
MRIIISHIPRTGGTSLFAALRAQNPAAKAVEFESVGQVALMTDKELNRYEMISTYVGSKLFDRLEGSWTKIVILRDPISRLRSSYWNLKTNSQITSFASSRARSGSFREYLASRDAAVVFQATNIQSWTILGDRSLSFRETLSHLDEGELCEICLDRLRAYEFVGFTEQLENLWSSLCQYFGWPVSQLPALNRNPPLMKLDDPTSEDVAFHTALDSHLVNRARGLNRVNHNVEEESSIS